MTTLLTAAACPPVATWDGWPGNTIGIAQTLTTGSSTAPVSQGYMQGETAQTRPKMNANAAGQDNDARFGGGLYGVCAGLTLSAGTGLQVSVAPGVYACDGPLELSQALSHAVPASQATVWVWLLRPAPGGVPSIEVHTTLTLPSGPGVLLGNVTTSATAVTAVDYSGVMYKRGPNGFRGTSDAFAPTDTPPASTSFVAETPSGDYYWSGTRYLYLPAASERVVTITLPAHLVTVTATETNDVLGVDFSGVGTFGSPCYIASAQATDPASGTIRHAVAVTEITGSKTASHVYFLAWQPSSDTGGAFNLTVRLQGIGWTPNPAPSVPAWDTPAALG